MTWAHEAHKYIKFIDREFDPAWDDVELDNYLRRAGHFWHGGCSWQKKVWPRACADYLRFWRHQNPTKVRGGK